MHRLIPRRRRYGSSRRTHHNHVACRTLIDDKSCRYGFNDLELFRSNGGLLRLPPCQERQLWRTSEEDIECAEELAGWLPRLSPPSPYSPRLVAAVGVQSPSPVRVRPEGRAAKSRSGAVRRRTR